MAEPTLYLFDGYNLLHAGAFADQRELTDALASFVAMRGARGVLVLDGAGADTELGPLAVRFAPHADALLERLAAEHRDDRGGLPRLLGLRRSRHLRAGGAEALLANVPRRPRAAVATPSRTARGSATRSTTRRARGSSGCAAANAEHEHTFLAESIYCKATCNLRILLLSSASTSG